MNAKMTYDEKTERFALETTDGECMYVCAGEVTLKSAMAALLEAHASGVCYAVSARVSFEGAPQTRKRPKRFEESKDAEEKHVDAHPHTMKHYLKAREVGVWYVLTHKADYSSWEIIEFKPTHAPQAVASFTKEATARNYHKKLLDAL